MKQLYDELDIDNNIVASSITLVPGLKLSEGHRWVEHMPVLEEVKAQKLAEIADMRVTAKFLPVVVSGNTWQVDSVSQSLITNSILLDQLGILPIPATWRTYDNIDVPASTELLKSIALEAAAQTGRAYTQSWELKAAVEAATTVEEVTSIQWV